MKKKVGKEVSKATVTKFVPEKPSKVMISPVTGKEIAFYGDVNHIPYRQNETEAEYKERIQSYYIKGTSQECCQALEDMHSWLGHGREEHLMQNFGSGVLSPEQQKKFETEVPEIIHHLHKLTNALNNYLFDAGLSPFKSRFKMEYRSREITAKIMEEYAARHKQKD